MTDYVKNTCKLGRGNDCCRYLVVGSKGFECVKHYENAKMILDARVAGDTITAQGDNCEGYKINESLEVLN